MGVRVSDALGGCQVASSCGSAAVRRAALCSAVAGLLLSACADTHSAPARQVTRSVKATPSYSAPRPARNPEVAAARPPAKAPQPAPLASLRHALRLAPHRGRGDADTRRDHAARAAKPAAARRGRRSAARGGKEGGRITVHRQADRRLEEPRGGSRAALHLQDRRRGGSGSPPSCASAVPRASTIRPSATSPPRTRRRSTRATRAGRGPPPSRATGLWSEGPTARPTCRRRRRARRR